MATVTGLRTQEKDVDGRVCASRTVCEMEWV